MGLLMTSVQFVAFNLVPGYNQKRLKDALVFCVIQNVSKFAPTALGWYYVTEIEQTRPLNLSGKCLITKNS